MKIGIFDPYLDILGGAERYITTIAEYYSLKDNAVDVFWQSRDIAEKLHKQFSLDMSKVRFIPFPRNTVSRMKILKNYDVLLYVTDGSIFWSTASRNILLIQTPDHIPVKKISNAIKLTSWQSVICYSQFMKRIIRQRMNRESHVLFPPIDVSVFMPVRKENIILSVGRFFPHLHSKKQNILIEAFKKLRQRCKLSNWKFVLIGSIKDDSDSLNFLRELQQKAQNQGIEIITNAPFSVLKTYYERAKIFWLATGFGEDLKTNPQKAEHFGLVSVEAMAAGCVPIVFHGGGQVEIITHGVNGYLFKTENELLTYTQRLIINEPLWLNLSKAARKRSHDFSREKFIQRFYEIVTS